MQRDRRVPLLERGLARLRIDDLKNVDLAARLPEVTAEGSDPVQLSVYAQQDLVAPPLDPENHRSTGWRKTHGIFEQMHEGITQQLFIGMKFGQVFLQLEEYLPFMASPRIIFLQLPYQGGDIDALR